MSEAPTPPEVSVRRSLPLMTGTSLRVGSQLIAALAATEFLGFSDFGYFVATLALARLAAPLFGLGGLILFFREHAGLGHELADEYWWRLTIGRTGTSLLGSLVVAVGARLFLGVPFLAGCFIGSTILALHWLVMVRNYFVVRNRVWAAASLDLARSISLLLPLGAFVFDASGLVIWSGWTAVSSMLFVLVAALVMFRQTSRAATRFYRDGWLPELGAGLLIGVALVAEAGSYQLDQFLLGSMGTSEDAATYGLAASGAFAALTPVNALSALALPQLLGDKPQTAARRYVVGTSCILTLAAFAAWPVWLALGELLDQPYGRVGILNVLLILALAPRAILLPGIARLHGRGDHGGRARSEALAFGANLTLNALLIPAAGYWGALGATMVSELLFVAIVWQSSARGRATRARRVPHAGRGSASTARATREDGTNGTF